MHTPFDDLVPGDSVEVWIDHERSPAVGVFHCFEQVHDQWVLTMRPVECCTKFWREWNIPTRDIICVVRASQLDPFKPADLHLGRVVLERCFRGDERTVR